ncbi:30S ribosomal protein S4 [Candidatus Woesearchaeota archaeon]|nr:30S ribosomal protein S4 [Candidatus Woesearchaeota archaeon]
MGSPRHPKKRYSRPFKIWNRTRLDSEKPIVEEYGLKNKKELWRTSSLLRKFTAQGKRLIALRGLQADVEKKQLIAKLSSLGLISADASIDEVLGLDIKDFLRRRLQTVVFSKKLSRSIKQSRQFIVQRHIRVGSRIITSPSFLVPTQLESQVEFSEGSSLSKLDHPERAAVKPAEVPDAKE